MATQQKGRKGKGSGTTRASTRKAGNKSQGNNQSTAGGTQAVAKAVLEEKHWVEGSMPGMRLSPTFEHMVAPDRLIRPKVAVVGFTAHRSMAFDLDESWEVWGINELHRHHPPQAFTRWFEVHDVKDFHPVAGDKNRPGDMDHLRTLSQFPIPVYMQDHYADMPSSVRFPKEAIEEGLPRGDYQTSSISWEVALAILWGAEEIAIYGVDMANDTEYAEQRPCLEYWMGIAEGRGIKVTVPKESDLTMAWGQYGWGGGDVQYAKMKDRLDWLHEQDNTYLAQLRQLDADYQNKKEQLLGLRNQTVGAINNTHYFMRSFGVQGSVPGAPTPDRTQDQRTGIGGQPQPAPGQPGGPPIDGGMPGGSAGSYSKPQLVTEGVLSDRRPGGTEGGVPTEPHGVPAEVIEDAVDAALGSPPAEGDSGGGGGDAPTG